MAASPNRLPAKRWSIAVWACVGALTVVLSYALALGLATIGLVLPVVLVLRMGLSFAALLYGAFGFTVSLTILWSLAPRRDAFEPPGVLIDLSQEKRLSAEIETISRQMKEPMPSEVYLIPDANAFVAQRGGFMGFGSRRVMGLGLPVLQILTTSQFRAILAHEFGHYYGGDTRMGPWIYNTRSAMVRVVKNFGETSDIMRILTRFFIISILHFVLVNGLVLYWKLFMRITQFVSRRQEYRSDELACHVAGSDALAGGLENICKIGAANSAYWNSVLLPVATSGFLPGIGDGFSRFMALDAVVKATSKALDDRLKNPKTDPFDTHPPLHARLARARKLSMPTADPVEQPAITLFDNLPALELALVRRIFPDLKEKSLRTVDWDTAGINLYIPLWKREVEPFMAILAQIKMTDFRTAVREPRALASQIPNPPGMLLNTEMRIQRAVDILTSAFSLCLVYHGWTLHAQPGISFLEKSGEKVQPSDLVTKLVRGKITEQSWHGFVTSHGMTEWTLSGAGSTEPAPTPASDPPRPGASQLPLTGLNP